MDIKETLESLKTRIDGLDEGEAAYRLEKYGRNELNEGKKKTTIQMFIDQFNNIMVIMLVIAALISSVLGEVTDMIIIMLVVLVNAVLGVIQENKAEKSLAALKQLSTPFVKVKRGGSIKIIKTELLVPGDMVILEAGDFVPADMRLIKISNLKIEEAALTGESVPSEKSAETLEDSELVIGDKINLAFSGSIVTYGHGEGIVFATGMMTEVGKIAKGIAEVENQDTPLQIKLHEMTKFLTITIGVISVVIFIVGVIRGRGVFEMLFTAVSLAVAAIPEGLPAVITIILAIGVQKMAKRNAIVRKLSAVETLGSTQVICSDKTGTLTQNKMTVKEVLVGGIPYDAGEFVVDNEMKRLYINGIILCNDTKVNIEDGQNKLLGDPTEVALVAFADKVNIFKKAAEDSMPRVEEIPFDSDRKLMTTIHQVDGRYMVFTKGAPDVLIEKCDGIFIDGIVRQLKSDEVDLVKESNSEMAKKALRVLAIAFKEVGHIPESLDAELVENGLTFIGLVGMMDPPRPEAKDAVAVCIDSGIRPIMITGDHKDTAVAIAIELGIIDSPEQVMTGSELNNITDDEFNRRVHEFSVYARVSPEHKVRIVDAWKRNGKIVAMTGDGVNDAPALKHSDIGIGMGIMGTDVSKSVSNIVLADDNFATIVIAVEEGRKVYSNMRKTIQFLLSCNLGEVLILFIATMMNWIILLPIHILWINLVTDTFPALALGVDTPEKDLMRRKPREAKDSFFSEKVGISIVYQGIVEAIIVLGVYAYSLSTYTTIVATTVAFATLGLVQLVHALNVKSVLNTLFTGDSGKNLYLIGAILVSMFLQISVITTPFLNKIFKVVPLDFEQWMIVVGASLSIIPIVEICKFIIRRTLKD